MSDDFYATSARQRYERICAERAAAQADLQAHRVNGDYDSAAYSIQQLANLDAEQTNLANLYNRYVAANQPRQPEQLTPEERQARPIEKMGWSDTVEMTRQSKYAKNIRADDPNMVAGYWEARRRGAVGNNHGTHRSRSIGQVRRASWRPTNPTSDFQI